MGRFGLISDHKSKGRCVQLKIVKISWIVLSVVMAALAVSIIIVINFNGNKEYSNEEAAEGTVFNEAITEEPDIANPDMDGLDPAVLQMILADTSYAGLTVNITAYGEGEELSEEDWYVEMEAYEKYDAEHANDAIDEYIDNTDYSDPNVQIWGE